MLLVTQFPFSDARPFASGSARLPVPHWRNPQPGEFVRGFGLLKKRRRGGHEAFADEVFFASARQAVKVPNLERLTMLPPPRRLHAVCAFRRLHCDGVALARLELGLRVTIPETSEHYQASDAAQADGALEAGDVVHLVSRVLELPVRITGYGSESKSMALHAAGPSLARLFADATALPAGPNTRPLVGAGAPLLLVQHAERELRHLPKDAREIDPMHTGGLPLAFLWREHGGRPVGIWFLREEPGASARALRLGLLRVHAEQQALKHVLALVIDGTLTYTRSATESDRLDQYLDRATTLLPESYPGAQPEKAIAEILHAYDQPITSDQRTLLAEALGQARRQITKKVERYLVAGEHASRNATSSERPIHVFVSYSHRDEAYVDNSEKSVLVFLAGLAREGFVFWHDRDLYASELWDERIREEMNRADVALILVSQFFLNSKYITDTELPALIAGRREKGLALFPLLVSPCDWDSKPWLASTQFLPRKGTIAQNYKTRGKRDQLYLEVLRTLRRIAAEKRQGGTSPLLHLQVSTSPSRVYALSRRPM